MMKLMNLRPSRETLGACAEWARAFVCRVALAERSAGIHDLKRLSARWAFGTTLSIASLFVPTLALSHVASRAALGDTPPNHTTCSVPSSTPQVVKDFVNLQCLVHAAIFADGTEPSVSYKMDAEPETVGTHAGLSYNNHAIEFDAVDVVAVKNQNDGSANYPPLLDGQMTYSLVGNIIGSAGKVPVFAMCFNEHIYGGQDRWLLMVTKIVDSATLDRFSQKNRILAGARAMSLVNYQSAPLKNVNVNGQALTASASDLGTMFVAGTLNTNPGTSVLT